MTQIELELDEQMTLREMLEEYLSDLRMEIAHTDSQDFRDGLKRRKAILMKTIDALRAA